MNVLQRIDHLIEESFLQSIGKSISGALKKITSIPKKTINEIKNKYNNLILESGLPSVAKQVSGKVGTRDSCYTAIMKLIHEPQLVKKYPNLDSFIKAYTKQGPLIPITNNNIDELKSGAIVFTDRDKGKGFQTTANRSYNNGKLGKIKENHPGHMMVFIEKDDNPKPYVFLDNSYPDDKERQIPYLELRLVRRDKDWLKKVRKKDYIFALDYDTISKM